MRNKYCYLMQIIIISLISSLGIGYSAFYRNLSINDLTAEVRIIKDVRVTGVSISSSNGSNIEGLDYNINKIFANVSLDNIDSYIIFDVEIANIGNQTVGLFSLDGLPSELDYELVDYDLGSKICSNDSSTKCSLGIKKNIMIKIKYKDGIVNPSVLGTFVNLNFDFEEFHNVDYEGIDISNLPREVINKGTLSVELNDIDRDGLFVYVDGNLVNNFSFDNNRLVINNINGDVLISYIPPVIDSNYNYFIDSYNGTLHLTRSDGASASFNYSTGTLNWYSSNVDVGFRRCTMLNTSATYTAYCLGNDGNFYYKKSGANSNWVVINTSSYIDLNTYDYYIYQANNANNGSYLVRSDGMTNRLTTSGLYYSAWDMGVNLDVVNCTGYNSFSSCIGSDDKFHYKSSFNTTNAWEPGNYNSNIVQFYGGRNSMNSWIDNSSKNVISVIQVYNNKMYNSSFNYSAVPTNEVESDIPGGGVFACCTDGGITTNYCLGKDGYIYSKKIGDNVWNYNSNIKFIDN